MEPIDNKIILLVTPGFAADEQDSTCIPFLQDYVLALKKIIPADRIKILAFQYPHKKGFYKWNGIEVFCANGQNEKGIVRIITWQRIISQLKTYFASDDNIIIHSFWLTEATLITQFVNRKWGYKHIATLLGQDAKASNRYLKRLKFNKFITVVPNKLMDNLLQSSCGQNADAIIPFAVKYIEPTPTEKRTIDLLFVGSMIKLKRPFDFIKICAILKNIFPNIKAVMIGDGILLKEVEEKIKELNLETSIEIKGKTPRQVAFDYMHASKILVHTSSFESQPTVAAEALACGMHMTTYDIGKIENTDKIYVCSDIQHMAETLTKLLSAPLDFTPWQPRTIDTVVSEYIQLYVS